MANRDLPRRGSRPANALSSLLSMGGKATVSELYRLAGKAISRNDFEMLVVEQLTFYGLIKNAGGEVALTDAGRAYLGVAKPAEVYVGKVAEPRVGTGFKPLRARSAMVIREGAFDYRNFPSRIGDTYLPFGEKSVA